MHQDPAYARRALEAGAAGFVVKHSAPAELVMAIRAALKARCSSRLRWRATCCGRSNTEHRKRAAPPRPATPASARSCGCWRRSLGQGNRRGARSRPAPSEFHKYQMMEAHGLRSNAELIHFAIKHGIVTI